jgi:dTDP-4-amino-4,6-dideoxygalactose transaminase
MGPPLRKSPGVPERRGRRGTAPIAPDRIPFQRPELPSPGAIVAHLADSAPCPRALAARIEQRLDLCALCVPVASATAGLMAALRALCGEPAGRRRLVACPSYTAAATAGAIAWAGFEPLFVDVEPHGFGLDAESLDATLRARPGRVAGILACAPFGSAPAAAVRAGWREVAADHGVALLLDSAPGFGAVDEDGRALGAQGDTEVFSFHATSTFAVGEGGAVTTPDPEVAARIARIVNFGLEPSSQTSTVAGFNGRLSELHAAAALALFGEFDEILATRRRLAARIAVAAEGAGLTYQRGSAGSPWQVFQAYAPDPAARERVLVAAAAGQVDARTLHDPPLHRHPAFASCERAPSLAVTEALAERAISLPLANHLSDDEVERIAAVARAAGA